MKQTIFPLNERGYRQAQRNNSHSMSAFANLDGVFSAGANQIPHFLKATINILIIHSAQRCHSHLHRLYHSQNQSLSKSNLHLLSPKISRRTTNRSLGTKAKGNHHKEEVEHKQ